MKKIPTAKDCMIKKFVAVTPDMDVFEAIDELVTKKVSGVPVINDEGKLEGVLTAKDCIRVLSNSHLHNQTGRTVAHFMSDIKMSLEPDMDIFTIATKFLSTNINTLPVIEGDRLVGIIARQDMLGCIRKMYLERGLDFLQDRQRRKIIENPVSIEDLQSLAGSQGKDQLASVLTKRHSSN